ncbi:hypothetical protein OAN307_c10820 [Octadecabacter antarcticus 307]|uniref:Uncharacterized protein n=1 Tax=Octadecabacter antarcticus 307 TaxID=391626 RepID=M9R3I1_9RHOB|nr:hypothetical protein [Octadecabacter antarcticus]AGI66787.1 hypothetical protein OAN307_c10820 [Octadecabacter antarcticus 307]
MTATLLIFAADKLGLAPHWMSVALARKLKADGFLTVGDRKNLRHKLPRAFLTGGSRAYALKLSELQKWSETLEQSEQQEKHQDISHRSDRSDRSDVVIACAACSI